MNDAEKEIHQANDLNKVEELTDNFSKSLKENSDKMNFSSELNKTVDVIRTIQLKTNDFALNTSSSKQVTNITNSIVNSLSMIVDAKNAWDSSKPHEKVYVAESVLNYVQFAGVTLGCTEVSLHLNLNLSLNFFEKNLFRPISKITIIHQIKEHRTSL